MPKQRNHNVLVVTDKKRKIHPDVLDGTCGFVKLRVIHVKPGQLQQPRERRKLLHEIAQHEGHVFCDETLCSDLHALCLLSQLPWMSNRFIAITDDNDANRLPMQTVQMAPDAITSVIVDFLARN